ncbi:MAG: hypothetical protein M4D80_12080 [Myxococcota bacterium]|nr:hypothetical protein [Myxococcota bacterium]
MRAAILVALVACADDPLEIEDMTCPPQGTTLTYDSFGQQFLGEHCNICHSTSKAGAPSGYKFDTHDQVKKHAKRIFIRSAGPNVTMPPGPDDPPELSRDQLAEWLACGAP